MACGTQLAASARYAAAVSVAGRLALGTTPQWNALLTRPGSLFARTFVKALLLAACVFAPALSAQRHVLPFSPQGAATPATAHRQAAAPGHVSAGLQVTEGLLSICRQHGVEVRTSTAVRAVRSRAGAVTGVELTDGSVIKADVVVTNRCAANTCLLAMAAATPSHRQDWHSLPCRASRIGLRPLIMKLFVGGCKCSSLPHGANEVPSHAGLACYRIRQRRGPVGRTCKGRQHSNFLPCCTVWLCRCAAGT